MMLDKGRAELTPSWGAATGCWRGWVTPWHGLQHQPAVGRWQNLLDWPQDTQPHSKLPPEPTEKGIPQASEPDFTPRVFKLF